MKKIAFAAAVLLFAACSKSSVEEAKKTAQDMRSGNTEPAKYADSLQNDVKKAEAVADQANKALKQTSQATENAGKDADAPAPQP